MFVIASDPLEVGKLPPLEAWDAAVQGLESGTLEFQHGVLGTRAAVCPGQEGIALLADRQLVLDSSSREVLLTPQDSTQAGFRSPLIEGAEVFSCALDGSFFAVGCSCEEERLILLNERLERVEAPPLEELANEAIQELAMGPRGRLLFACGADLGVLWHRSPGGWKVLQRLRVGPQVFFSPDGCSLGSWDGKVAQLGFQMMAPLEDVRGCSETIQRLAPRNIPPSTSDSERSQELPSTIFLTPWSPESPPAWRPFWVTHEVSQSELERLDMGFFFEKLFSSVLFLVCLVGLPILILSLSSIYQGEEVWENLRLFLFAALHVGGMIALWLKFDIAWVVDPRQRRIDLCVRTLGFGLRIRQLRFAEVDGVVVEKQANAVSLGKLQTGTGYRLVLRASGDRLLQVSTFSLNEDPTVSRAHWLASLLQVSYQGVVEP
jgi:hypothetical protein